MPFSYNKVVLPVLPKPDHGKGEMLENISLSAIEDKELRKKLRNRQSALAARERKKARMLELEKQVAELQESGKRKEEENQYLKKRLNLLLRRCIRSGMPLCNDKDLLQITQPILSQAGCPPQHNNDTYRRGCKRSNCLPNRHTMFHKTLEMHERKFMQNHPARNSSQDFHGYKPMSGNSCNNYQLELPPSVSTPVPNPSVEACNSASKPFVTLRRPNVDVHKAHVKKEVKFSQQTDQMVLPQDPLHRPFSNVYNAQKEHSGNLHQPQTSVFATSIPTVSKMPSCSNISQKRSLPSIGSMLEPSVKCSRTEVAPQTSFYENRDASVIYQQKLIRPTPIKQEIERQGFNINKQESIKEEFVLSPDLEQSVLESVSDAAQFHNQRKVSSDSCQQACPNTQHDFNFNVTCSENEQNSILDTGLSDIFCPSSHNTNDGDAEIFDFQDIILSDNSFETTSSNSSSNLSIVEDHFDWVIDNPIFAI